MSRPPARQDHSRSGWALGIALLALLFTHGCYLWQNWEFLPEYSYGWLIPPLALYLFHLRWLDQPQPQAARTVSPLFFFLFLFLPWPALWIFREANPDWRMLAWAGGLLSAGGMLLSLLLAGGGRWARHFAVPILLLLLAVPWPSGLENSVVQAMTRAVTATTVEALTWCGIFAEQRGNTIALARGTLGVDEACSGIRSFQSNLMAALVVGELFRLSTLRRFLLLLSALGLGFVLNLCRGLFLAWSAHHGGLQAVELWHDPAGYTILGVSFVLLLLLARGLRAKALPPTTQTIPPWPELNKSVSIAFILATVWLVLSPLASELWYRSCERGLPPDVNWQLGWSGGTEPRTLPIPDRVRTILRYDEGRALRWNEPDGKLWLVYELVWGVGKSGASLARSHTPEICLPAAGATLVEAGGDEQIAVHGLPLLLRCYTFTVSDRPIHVFFLINGEPGAPNGPRVDYYDPRERIRSALQGRRNRGQRVIHATLLGFDSAAVARQAFLGFLDKHLQPALPALPKTP
ncbi:MAG: exosortase/archaeosortase family protein [Candidatus Methylacidiphilales bacterium]|nr:exosortase/archaeosortase family protein [Candidatus Methylacidiphilales bacterium]